MKNNVFIPIRTTDCGESLITAPRWSWGYGGAVKPHRLHGKFREVSHSATKLAVCEVWKAVPKKWRLIFAWGDKSTLPPIKFNSLELRQKLTVAILGTSHGTRCYRQNLTMTHV